MVYGYLHHSTQHRAIQDRCALMRVDTPRFVLRFVHSCILPRPSTQTRWVAQSRNRIFSTSASNSKFSIVYPIHIPMTLAGDPTQRESHLGSAEEAGSRSLVAHVSGPHDAPIIPYHAVLSSPAFSDPSGISRLKYTSRSCQTSVTLATSIIKPPCWSSQVYHPAPPTFFHLHFH